MYLITRPEDEAKSLINLLQIHQVDAAHLPIMEIIAKPFDFVKLSEQLPAYDSLFFVSPSAIKLAHQFIVELDGSITVIVAGNASKQKMLAINPRLKIVAPVATSGIDALINEGLLTNVRNILIFGGDSINPKLIKFGELNQINIQFIDLYARVNVVKSSFEQICHRLSAEDIEGVIVTSRDIATWMAPIFRDERVKQRLNKIKFISIHPQITNVLHSYSVPVVETLHSDNQSVLNLIRELKND